MSNRETRYVFPNPLTICGSIIIGMVLMAFLCVVVLFLAGARIDDVDNPSAVLRGIAQIDEQPEGYDSADLEAAVESYRAQQVVWPEWANMACAEGEKEVSFDGETYRCKYRPGANALEDVADDDTVEIIPAGDNSAIRNEGNETEAIVDPRINNEGFCPTRRQVNTMLFGADVDRVVQVSMEDGAWQINTGSPQLNYEVVLPANVGLIATIHEVGDDLAEVWVGDGSTHQIFRGTFRFAGCYDLEDDVNATNAPVRILVKENFDGTWQEWVDGIRPEDWQYSVIAGNFMCPTNTCPSSNLPNNSAAGRTDALPAQCPTFAGYATTPGNDGAPFCKYQGNVVTAQVPAGWVAQYWTGAAVANANPGSTITTGEATFRPANPN